MIENDSNLHLEKLHQQYTNIPADRMVLEELTGTYAYQWNHPFINRFIFECLNEKIQQNLDIHLGIQDLERCCLELINRPSSSNRNPTLIPNFDDEDLNRLRQLACEMDRPWVFSDARKIGVPGKDLKEYFNHKVIVQYNPPFCKVADGLREFFQDLDRLIREETEA
jgi:hypothetical protein